MMTLDEYKEGLLARYNALPDAEKEMVRGIMRTQYAPVFVKVLGMDLLSGLPQLMPSANPVSALVEE